MRKTEKTTRQVADDRKLQELILYIARRCAGDETLSAVKLNKLLFNIDFERYARVGRSVTGHPYMKLQWGPVPVHFLRNRKELESSNRLKVVSNLYLGRRQEKPIALDDANLAIFDGEEIALTERVIREWWGKSATEISNFSHEFAGWRLTELRESIPYGTALLATLPVTESDLRAASELEDLAKELLAT